jgi:hypothetical protein
MDELELLCCLCIWKFKGVGGLESNGPLLASKSKKITKTKAPRQKPKQQRQLHFYPIEGLDTFTIIDCQTSVLVALASQKKFFMDDVRYYNSKYFLLLI